MGDTVSLILLETFLWKFHEYGIYNTVELFLTITTTHHCLHWRYRIVSPPGKYQLFDALFLVLKINRKCFSKKISNLAGNNGSLRFFSWQQFQFCCIGYNRSFPQLTLIEKNSVRGKWDLLKEIRNLANADHQCKNGHGLGSFVSHKSFRNFLDFMRRCCGKHGRRVKK